VRAVAGNQNLAFELLPYDPRGGQTVLAELEKYRGQDITAVVIQQPNSSARWRTSTASPTGRTRTARC
jgi:hypothetical protein